MLHHSIYRRNSIVVYIALMMINISCDSSLSDEYRFKEKREEMVLTQIIARGIKDKKVINAMRNVGRHHFVASELQNQSYDDHPLPIGEGQTISQPYIVAYMTEALDIKDSDKILEIGTGSGYQAAILAEICKDVYTIEINENLGKSAIQTIAELGYDNIHIKVGDGFLGWDKYSPYNSIIVTCSPSKIPEPLVRQLADGGKIIIPVNHQGAQDLILFMKVNGKLIEKSVLPVRFVPMIDNKGSSY